MKLSEQFALSDLEDNAISNITSKYLFDREHGKGTNVMNVENVRLKDDKMYIQYKSDPTYESEAKAINLQGKEYTTKSFDTIFEFQSATDFLGDIPSYIQMNPTEQIEIVRGYIDNGMARVWCSCPAFYYQGMWEAMDSHGSTVFNFPGPKGKGIWKAKHRAGLVENDIYICKHIASCIHKIDNDIPTIAKTLLKSLGAPR